MSMSSSVHTSEPRDERVGALGTAAKVRLAAFSIVAVAIIALNVVMTPRPVLLAFFLSWGGEFGIHQVHDMAISALLWAGLIVPLALVLYHPSERVNTVLAPVLAVSAVAVFAYLADSFLFTGFLTSAVLAVVALALHPAGRSLFRFDRVGRVDRRAAAVFAVGAVPLLAYAALEVSKQLTLADEHAALVHYGAMGITAFLVVLLGGLAVLRERDWRIAAWVSGLLAASLGVVSLVFPTIESSLGFLGGGLAVLWAVAVVASVEYGRRSDDREDSRGESVVDAV
ncbi:hypothetical protein [Haloarcula marina]|uniref:hypothetical protein n=1 Tax=Haloarcula marina TaxID=2961574 RepID=UPI0020B71873|nr:hypothetical protein [Halomicroarcula marina]